MTRAEYISGISRRCEIVHLGDAETVGEARRAGERRIVVRDRLLEAQRVGTCSLGALSSRECVESRIG